MRGWQGRTGRWSARLVLGSLAWAGPGLAAEWDTKMPNARLKHPLHRAFVSSAIQGAAARLAHAECQGLLDEFTDGSGRPLRSVLEGKSKYERSISVAASSCRSALGGNRADAAGRGRHQGFFEAAVDEGPRECQLWPRTGRHDPGASVRRGAAPASLESEGRLP